jgi:hypothetical protein
VKSSLTKIAKYLLTSLGNSILPLEFCEKEDLAELENDLQNHHLDADDFVSQVAEFRIRD